MKIISVMTSGAQGGAEFAAVELLAALAQRGHDVRLQTDVTELAAGRLSCREIDLGPKLSKETYSRLAVSFPALARRLRRRLRDEEPFDVLLVHFKKEQLLTLALPRSSRPVCVWAEWGPLPFQFRKGVPNLVYRLAARRADLVLAISSGTKVSLVDAGLPPDKIVVVPNAVRVHEIRFDAEGRLRVRRELGIPDDAFVVGCVSRFNHKKRNDVVIDAVKALDDVHLVVAGSGETEAALREQARPLGDRVRFIPTPTEDVASVYSAFDVSVFCPSPTEGAPRAVILAMLAERPVVATGKEGVTDLVVRDTGVILDSENDPSALADALRRYAESPETRIEHGDNARRLAASVHDSDTVAAELESLLLAASRSRGRSR